MKKNKLRDKFAMAALQALIVRHGKQLYPDEAAALRVRNAKSAYKYADAMLEARKNEV